jgi:diketogulonate reductase-like aldo/keto reductase
MQFYWWDYRNKSYLDALNYMVELQNEGKIKHLALTNFDTKHLKIITDAGIKIVSNQVQFSLVDRRPEVNMVQYVLNITLSFSPTGHSTAAYCVKNTWDNRNHEAENLLPLA